jgi:CubicO group peptidase (beta-lactamase class C family)
MKDKEDMMKQYILLSSSLLAIMSADSRGQPFPSELADHFQDLLQTQYELMGFTGISAAIIMPKHGTWHGAAGMSDPVNEIAMDPKMLFWTGCIDKMFTSTVILQLVDEELLDLEDPLHKWLPTYTNIDSTITIRQLLDHTNGLYRWHFNHTNPAHDSVKTNPEKHWTSEDFLLTFIVDSLPPNGQGKEWVYHEVDYVLLNMIIDEVTQSDTYLQYHNRIGAPLQLNETNYIWSDTISAQFAQPNEEWRDFYGMAAWSIGGSRIMSTPEDIASFTNQLFKGALLDQASLEQMYSFIETDYYYYPNLTGYGLGLYRFQYDDKELWGHWGHDPGYSSAAIYWPEKDVSFAFFINEWGWLRQINNLIGIFADGVNHYFEFPFDKVHPKNVMVADPYVYLDSGTLTVYSNINNPENHEFQVKAIISNSDYSYMDSTEMNDEGINGDLIAGDGISSCNFNTISREDIFTVSVKTKDIDSLYNHVLPGDFVTYFTTIGPIEWSTYELEKQSDSLYTLKVTLKNDSQIYTISNVSANLSSKDPNVTQILTSNNPQEFPDIEPGDTVECYGVYAFYAQNDPALINFTLEISSDGHHFWSDSQLVSDIETNKAALPLQYTLRQNYPNPFNPVTMINYQLPMINDVDLSIYNILGQRVATLVNEKQKAGSYQVEWDASGYASGVFYYRIEAGEFQDVKKMVLLR